MLKYLFCIGFLFFGFSGLAQKDTTALYLQYPTIPYFTITKVSDSSKFSRADLAPKKATIIFIFSPDCGHCQQKIQLILDNQKLFAKAQIIMASPLEHRILKKFYQEYKIAQYPNITMANDPGYFFGSFYSVKSLPSIFVYNKKGRLKGSFDGNSTIKEITKGL